MGGGLEVWMVGEQGERRVRGKAPHDRAPYLGPFGKTRSEPVQVWMPDGTIQSLRVYVSIDAGEDPALATLARAGTLHHVADGVALAVPFVYHDGASETFLLVVPEELRHRALALRAEQMALIAEAKDVDVPDYVRDVDVVIGTRELVKRIELGPRLISSPPPSMDLSLRVAALAERERSVERRERLLSAREEAQAASPAVDRVLDSELEEVHEGDAIDPEATVIAVAHRYEEDEVEDENDEFVDESDDESEEVEDTEEVDDLEELAAEDEVSDLDDDDDDDDVVEAVPIEDAWPVHEYTGRINALVPISEADSPMPRPPEAFLSDPSAQLAISVHEGRVWLFVRNRPKPPRDRRDLDVLIQVDPEATVPVVVMTLLFEVNGEVEARRGVIDPEDPSHTAALSALTLHFELQLASLEADGTVVHWARLSGPRAANVTLLLGHLKRLGPVDRSAWSLARMGALEHPLPWVDDTQPFEDEGSAHSVTATEAAVAVDELAPWLAPERRQRALLLLGVPEPVIEAQTRRVISDALDFGISLPPALRDAALSLGIARDEAELLKRRIDGLCRTSRESDLSGLEEPVLRALWSEAVEQTARLGVSMSAEAREIALEHAGERALKHLDMPVEPHDAALDPARRSLVGDAPVLKDLSELAQRGGYRDLVGLGRVASQLSPEEVTGIFAKIARRTDITSLDALTAIASQGDDLRVRISAALALAARRAPSSISTLATMVAEETDPAFRAFALALGRYGGGSLRAVSRALVEAGVDEERAAYVYAHLAQHGALAQIRAKTRVSDEREARVSTRALELARELKDEKSEPQGLEKQGWLTVFCELFDRQMREFAR